MESVLESHVTCASEVGTLQTPHRRLETRNRVDGVSRTKRTWTRFPWGSLCRRTGEETASLSTRDARGKRILYYRGGDSGGVAELMERHDAARAELMSRLASERGVGRERSRAPNVFARSQEVAFPEHSRSFPKSETLWETRDLSVLGSLAKTKTIDTAIGRCRAES